MTAEDERDPEAYCEEAIPRVSRSFALSIAKLPPPQRAQVGTSYLLCRIADAIEDDVASPIALRRGSLYAFAHEVERIASNKGGEDAGVPDDCIRPVPSLPPGEFAPSLSGTNAADRELLRSRGVVLKAFSRLPRDVRLLVAASVVEMCAGMAELLQDETTHPIATVADLERYCFYVAGTVGLLLTGIFSAASPIDASIRARLRDLAPRFAEVLQLVNVVKDAWTDLREGRCFLPRELVEAPVRRTPTPAERVRVTAALDVLTSRAEHGFSDAGEYVLALPKSATDARTFCLVPLLLAVRTVGALRASTWAEGTKVSRDVVAEEAAWVATFAGDDAAIVARFRLRAARLAISR